MRRMQVAWAILGTAALLGAALWPWQPVFADKAVSHDPGTREARFEAARRRFELQYADAIRLLHLSPDQANRFIEQLANQEMRFSDMGGIPGQEPGEAFMAEWNRVGRADDAQLRSILGSDKYARWIRYVVSRPERQEVAAFRAQLVDSEPLNDIQAEALVDVLYVERSRYVREYRQYTDREDQQFGKVDYFKDQRKSLELLKQSNRRILAAMAGKLSAAQLASLEQMLAAQVGQSESLLRAELGR